MSYKVISLGDGVISNKYSTSVTINPDLFKSYHKIVVSDCPKCGSNLPLKEIDDNGICTCKFCGKDVYVWD